MQGKVERCEGMERGTAGEGNAQQNGTGSKQSTPVNRPVQEPGGEDKFQLKAEAKRR